MLFHMKDHKAAVLENDLNKLQKDGPAAWAELPEDELFTPAGFSEAQAEATASTSYSYWGSTFRAFFKNKLAVALLAALALDVSGTFQIVQRPLHRARREMQVAGNGFHARPAAPAACAVAEVHIDCPSSVRQVRIGVNFTEEAHFSP